MNVYFVAPECTNLKKFVMMPEWRVIVTMQAALAALDTRHKELNLRHSGIRPGLDPILLVSTVPDESLYAHCSCAAGYTCDHSPFFFVEGFNPEEVLLKVPVRNWARVTKQDVIAWRVERQLVTGWKDSRFMFESTWLERMPITE